MTPKAYKTKEKYINGILSKFQSSVSKAITKKIKRQPREWEKFFANHISDRRLVSRIYEELI